MQCQSDDRANSSRCRAVGASVSRASAVPSCSFKTTCYFESSSQQDHPARHYGQEEDSHVRRDRLRALLADLDAAGLEPNARSRLGDLSMESHCRWIGSAAISAGHERALRAGGRASALPRGAVPFASSSPVDRGRPSPSSSFRICTWASPTGSGRWRPSLARTPSCRSRVQCWSGSCGACSTDSARREVGGDCCCPS